MIIFHLKKQWFDKIKAGKKRHEYRVYNDYWKKRIHNFMVLDYVPVLFACGYPKRNDTKRMLKALVTGFAIIDGKNTDLKYDGQVIDFEFKLLEE